jgi:hypothetical protein
MATEVDVGRRVGRLSQGGGLLAQAIGRQHGRRQRTQSARFADGDCELRTLRARHWRLNEGNGRGEARHRNSIQQEDCGEFKPAGRKNHARMSDRASKMGKAVPLAQTISKLPRRKALNGDRRVRRLLYEAANVMLTRYKGQLKLKDWAFAIARRSTMRKARVALARRLAIIMHAMLRDGTEFASA